ncbi:MAG TPA: DUF262 domain-containing protein [Terricaulis sp.]|nr:DUF262 domain-containing protein [Terricaulis sp.]
MADEAEFEIEEEDEEEAYVEYDIATYPSDYTIESLSQMMGRNDIVVPQYQRKYVWTIKQASLLVESFLLGLPVPPLFLYVTDENKYEVIDGQQRLLSMMYYLDDYFGEADKKGRRQLFKLAGLSERSPFRNKRFDDLDEPYQRKLRSSVLRAINIRQLNPAKTNTSVFHIFERLNTGGTTLKAQEIRNAVFRGQIVDSLQSLNRNEAWRIILGTKSEDKFQRDVELLLRLFALYGAWNEYEKPMKEYLNKEMQKNRKFDSERASEFEQRFLQVITTVVEGLGARPFRPRRVINAAVLEAVMVTLLEHPEITPQALAARYPILIAEKRFQDVIRGATTDTKMVKDRLAIAEEVITS